MLQHTFYITKTLLHVRNASKSNTGLEHSILVYTGLRKTFAYYRKQVHFKYMIADINYYSNLCQTHKIGKPDNQRTFGPLHMILLLSRPWKDRVKQVRRLISGFRSHSGLSDRECTAIRLVKYIVHATPSSQMYRTRRTLLLDFEFVYKLYRLQDYIVSNRYLLFRTIDSRQNQVLISITIVLLTVYSLQIKQPTVRRNKTTM